MLSTLGSSLFRQKLHFLRKTTNKNPKNKNGNHSVIAKVLVPMDILKGFRRLRVVIVLLSFKDIYGARFIRRTNIMLCQQI